MSHHVHRWTERKSDYLISISVHYVHLGGDNKQDIELMPESGSTFQLWFIVGLLVNTL